MLRKKIESAALLFLLMIGSSPVLAATLSPGDILVLDSILKGIIRVDPTTGNRSIVSHSSVGTGNVNFTNPTAILVIPIPEPSTLMLAALTLLGPAGLAACRRRRPL